MDQNTSGGSDKRNWRERLGIGTKDAKGSDMPRVASEFKPARPNVMTPMAARPAAPPPVSSVSPAPMAPRVAARPVQVATAARPPSLQPDALALKLKSQREAAEKMAEQRVIAARQRAEAALAPMAAPPGKPKFAFADEDVKPVRPIAQQPVQQQPAQHQQMQQQPLQQQRGPAQRPASLPQSATPLPPPRPQLGGSVPVPQRAPVPKPQAYPQGQPFNQQQGYSNNYVPVSQQQPQQNYAPPPAYRPIDPATGYAPPPAYVPNPGFAQAPRQNYDMGAPAQPRLNMPPRNPQMNPAPTGYDPRMAPSPQRGYNEPEADDIFEQPLPQRGQRRATANDYQRAYRESESGYEEESRSNVPWILVGLLALVLAGFGSIWAYANYVKPVMVGNNSANTEQTVPVVKAPEQATKVTPTVEAEPAAAAAGQVVTPTKKQIYDRIVGDREVLGGQIVPTEETPVQPSTNAQPVPAPDAGTGTDGIPLPLPPPPGATGDGQQGSLEPSPKSDQQIATITPAASESLAAVPLVAPPQIPEAPVPGTQEPLKPAQTDAPLAEEKINDSPAPTPEPATKIQTEKPKKIATAPKIEKSLGSKPVVLVPPSKRVVVRKPQNTEVASNSAADSLYGDGTDVVDTTLEPATPIVAAPKRKSLLDLFKRDKGTVDQDIVEAAPAITTQPAQKVATLSPEVTAPKPTGAFVAQLASFKSKSEATQEYARMKAKHGAIISRYAPIISQAQVAGTTRYRLNLGPMASSGVASSFCQSLFAAGERDCLVQRQ
jgi:SPOR domain